MLAHSASTASGRCTPIRSRVLNEVFTPSADEVERARAIVSALECEGRGAVEVDGQMVDEASRKLALQVLARAEAAGSGQ